LASEQFVFNIPDLPDGLKIYLTWEEPDTSAAGSPWEGRVIGGYRIYRTVMPDQSINNLVFLRDVDAVGGSECSAGSCVYIDDGQPVTPVPIPNCPDGVPGSRPLQVGATTQWVEVASLALNSARKGAGLRAVTDRTSNRIFFYAVSGLDTTDNALSDYEYLVLDYDAGTNPLQWEPGGGWIRVTGALPDITGGNCSGPSGRWQAGLHLFNADNSSLDGTTFAITDDEQYVYLGPGLTGVDVTTAAGIFQSWRIDTTTGTLDPASYDEECSASASNAGYGNIGANRQVFHFGGVGPINSVKAVQWDFVATPSPHISIGNNSYNDNGSSLLSARHLHGTVLDRAFIYILGGAISGGVTDTIEFGIW
jgi:hypothetical protein